MPWSCRVCYSSLERLALLSRESAAEQGSSDLELSGTPRRPSCAAGWLWAPGSGVRTAARTHAQLMLVSGHSLEALRGSQPITHRVT